MTAMRGADSKLFEPLTIGNGKITLKHRVVLAPLTRNRGTPLNESSTPENPNRIWIPNEVITEYYAQRATDGGLLITEGLPPSLESNGMPGVPGIFLPEQCRGWKKVVDAAHAKGGFIYAQIWHAGRATISAMTGSPPVSASVSPFEIPDASYTHIPVGATEKVRYVDSPPIELSVPHIKQTIQDYCKAAKNAIDVGFDGVELHGANGYLPEQFLSSNINKRTDEYGGSPEKRCKFVLELMDELAKTVGEENLAIRLSPFGLFNETRGEQRLETWTYLCTSLKKSNPDISYVSFVEPRFDQFISAVEKDEFLKSWGLENIDLSNFRKIMGSTPFFSGGGWNDTNSWGVLESGSYDAFVYGRYFISNPDFVERLKIGRPLTPYDRSTFYGPLPDPKVGYIDYPTMEQEDAKK